jgi:hypothetical protein
MVDSGKELYFKDVVPRTIAMLIRWDTKEQLEWCIENESYMWRYFIEKKCFT